MLSTLDSGIRKDIGVVLEFILVAILLDYRRSVYLCYIGGIYCNLYCDDIRVIYLLIHFFSVPDHVRPRVCSLPEKPYNPRSGDELYRLRTFSITNKGGVVNCGDSIINRRSRSNTSVNSTTSKWILYLHIYFYSFFPEIT